ncbi:MAG TPA: LuxR C-terminal-related transcriptional regulator [Nocardioides sp.]|nr:LuxR C-terminal-related transcriptional regulator [Nocardioides sp.]
MEHRSISVCVVSGHPILAAGIRVLLDEQADADRSFTVVTDPADADVVIYDVFRLASRAGDDVPELDELIASHPQRVLALSRLLQPGLTARALAAGAVAPVSIGADGNELAALVEAAAHKDLANDPDLAREHQADLARRLGADVGLTPREQSVLALIAAGHSNDAIAAELYVSINTVKSTIRSIYNRIGAHSRADAVAWAIGRGYSARRSTRPTSTRG